MGKRQDPIIDHGFHAVIPRTALRDYIGREGEITTEKGERKKVIVTHSHILIYVYFKDLCGESGTCYRTTRTLAKELKLSTGLISEAIRLLHAVGLIHAEKKKRTSGGKPVWHITIVDIWGLNGKLHPTKRSVGEQPPKENVQQVNGDRRVCSSREQERSVGEQECSLNETEEGGNKAVSLSRKNNEAGSKRVRTPNSRKNQRISPPCSPSSSLSSQNISFQKEETNKGKESFILTEQEQHFWTLWLGIDQHQQAKPELKEIGYGHLKAMATAITTQEQMDRLVTLTRKKLSQRHKREIWKVELGNIRQYIGELAHEMQKEQEAKGKVENKRKGESGLYDDIPDERVVWYSKYTDLPVGNIFEYWYLFDRAPMGEVRKLGRVAFPSKDGKNVLRSFYRQYARGEKKLPADAIVTAPVMKLELIPA